VTDPWVDYQLAHMTAPMLGVWGNLWAELLGGAKQDASDLSTDATLAHFPITAPTDALAYLGRDRRIPQAPGETNEDYVRRLVDAFGIWGLSGTEAGVVSGFTAAGLTAYCVENFETANAWGHWARFVVYTDGTGVFGAPPLWDDFDWDDGTRWDFSAADGALVDYLVAWIRLMKPAHTRSLALVIARTGYPTVIVPIEPVPGVDPPLDPGDAFADAYLDAYLELYLG